MIDAKSLLKGHSNISPSLMERLVSAKTAVLTPLGDKSLMQIADKAVEDIKKHMGQSISTPFNMAEIIVEFLAKDCSARTIPTALKNFLSQCEKEVYKRGYFDTPQICIERHVTVNWEHIGLILSKGLQQNIMKTSEEMASSIIEVDDYEEISKKPLLIVDLASLERIEWEDWMRKCVDEHQIVVGYIKENQCSVYKPLSLEGIKVISDSETLSSDVLQMLGNCASHRAHVLKHLRDRKRRFIKATYHKNIVEKGSSIIVELSRPELETTFDPNDFDVPFMKLHQPRFDFSAVIGQEEVKAFLTKIKDQFASKKSREMDLPKGVIFTGPPGTGKTMLSEAMAGEMKLPFVAINSADIIAQGNPVSNIKRLFSVIDKISPCLVFFDEFDSLGRARSENNASHNLAVNTLLAEMDGVKSNRGRSLFLAATNFDNVLDPALMRAGRFETSIEFTTPDKAKRESAIATYAENFGYDLLDREIAALAKIASGFTYKKMENIFRDAELFHATEPKSYRTLLLLAIGVNDLNSVHISPERLKSKAIHEASQFFCIKHDNSGSEIPFLSARYNSIEPDMETLPPIATKATLHKALIPILGGYAGESELLGQDKVSASSFSDVQKATHLAKSVLIRLGSFEGFEGIDTTQLRSFEAYVDKQTGITVDSALQDAKRIIRQNRSMVLKLSGLLTQHDFLLSDDLQTFEINTSNSRNVVSLH